MVAGAWRALGPRWRAWTDLRGELAQAETLRLLHQQVVGHLEGLAAERWSQPAVVAELVPWWPGRDARHGLHLGHALQFLQEAVEGPGAWVGALRRWVRGGAAPMVVVDVQPEGFRRWLAERWPHALAQCLTRRRRGGAGPVAVVALDPVTLLPERVAAPPRPSMEDGAAPATPLLRAMAHARRRLTA